MSSLAAIELDLAIDYCLHILLLLISSLEHEKPSKEKVIWIKSLSKARKLKLKLKIVTIYKTQLERVSMFTTF